MAKAKKRGSSYRVQVYVGKDENGKQIKRSVTAPTKREAERIAANIRIDNHNREDPTFSEAAKGYIDSRANILSPSTVAGYEKIIRNHISIIKNIRLSRISNDDIQRQIDLLAADHAPKTVDNARAFIVSVLKYSAPDIRIKLTSSPKEKKEKTIPTDKQLHKLLECAEDPFMKLAIQLAAFGSLRESEVSGLFRDCVFDDYITIKRVMIEKPGGGFVIKNHPKSYAGYRDIYLPADIIAALQLTEEGPIIPYNPRQIRQRFETIRKKADCYSITFHSLRHYFATFLHSNGLPDKTIAKIGGWENVETLQRIYQHSTKQKEEAAAALIADHFKNISP